MKPNIFEFHPFYSCPLHLRNASPESINLCYDAINFSELSLQGFIINFIQLEIS